VAHLWGQAIDGEWHAHVLGGAPVQLFADAPRVRLAPSRRSAADPSEVCLWPSADAAAEDWALLAGPASTVRINGRRVDAGIAVLRDRDEIRVAASAPLFFSSERLASVSLFPDDGTRGFCPRCKQAIAAGSNAVRCPGCGIWHHASEELPCWTYAERCAACPQPTALDHGFRWTPEDL
jgi:hypothetical protein